MMRRLRALLCRFGLHVACEHPNGGRRERVLAELDRRYAAVDADAALVAREIERARVELLADVARQRRRQR